MITRLVLVAFIASYCVPFAAVQLQPPFILSVTASGDFSLENQMIAFNTQNVSNQLQKNPFSWYESALTSSYDHVHQRYFILCEGPILVYSAITLELLDTIPYPLEDFWPDTMHYDTVTDLVWLLYISEQTSQAQYCSLPANSSRAANVTCYSSFAGSYEYTPDASAFDREQRTIWTMVTDSTRNYLIGFNVDTHTDIEGVPVAELCQNMEIAVVENTTCLVCVTFAGSTLVRIHQDTGKMDRIHKFNEVHPPNPYATTVGVHPDRVSSSYYASLYGALTYEVGSQLTFSPPQS